MFTTALLDHKLRVLLRFDLLCIITSLLNCWYTVHVKLYSLSCVTHWFSVMHAMQWHDHLMCYKSDLSCTYKHILSHMWQHKRHAHLTELNIKPASHTNMWPFYMWHWQQGLAQLRIEELPPICLMSWNLNLNWNRFGLQEAELEWHEVEFTEFQFKEIMDFFPPTLIPLSVRILKPYFKTPARFSRSSPSIKGFLLKSNF